jgi:pimeloyl-ACP methyl ester carboxylesterase
MPYIRLDSGLRLYYEDAGAGPPLLLMDGLGATWVWFKNTPALSRHFRVIALDTKGVGRSDKPPGPYTVPQIARETVELIDRLGLGRTHLMGLSLGAQVALEIALTFPEHAGRLVPIGATPGGPGTVPPHPDTIARMIPVPGLTPLQNARRNFTAALSPAYTATYPAELDAMLRMAAQAPTPPFARVAMITAGATWPGLGSRAERLRNPVLVLSGEWDRIAPVPNAVLLTDLLPNARLRIFPGSGHLCNVEQTATFNQVVTEFLLGQSKA